MGMLQHIGYIDAVGEDTYLLLPPLQTDMKKLKDCYAMSLSFVRNETQSSTISFLSSHLWLLLSISLYLSVRLSLCLSVGLSASACFCVALCLTGCTLCTHSLPCPCRYRPATIGFLARSSVGKRRIKRRLQRRPPETLADPPEHNTVL